MENRIEEEEEGNQLTMAAAAKGDKSVDDHHHHHPYAFHVSGPRNLSSPNWTDLIISTWKDENYKRMVMACFIQSVYLLELDRQEKRTKENSLAPKWWIPFKYKLTETLIDERDGSIFGAVLEWDGFIFMRPSGAPKAVLALRGSNNICIAGHSLGAGFALQVGKTLAHQGVYVEAHLFNPPSVSLSMSMKNIGEKAIFAYNRFKSILPFNAIIGEQTNVVTNITPPSSSSSNGLKKYWIPHLYVNNNDYICCYYTDQPKTTPIKTENKGTAKLFVLSKGKQKFLEAHKLEQWWSDDLELQLALQTSTLISKQLQSLYI
ncbi:GDSL esterase/lipase At4g10955-like isoform X2 [Impatiens glandulifera]|uniref:GDSL esterase/lipase At4g10955-like isoform X2 n=1 Tax=Impatiens glandulifera TaxID=253017 RepID=UPI001FB0F13C|nr:GDSL esterase/lipase At4g10955-like isoform X2 [Impatiens glandulifera]